ncbi:MAG: dockerin type I repeat-containing protein [Limisphaerales bacterium]
MNLDGDDEPKSKELKKLEAALRELEKGRVFVPEQVDQKIVAEIQNHFRQEKAEASGEEIARVDRNAKGLEGIGSEDGKLMEASDVLFWTKRVKGKRRPKRWQGWMQKALPLAASIIIAAVMIQFARMGRTVAGDVNADGTVDVVDALLLAERVRGGQTARRWDVNGDRVVDARDSEEIMARVVDLERSGS